MANIRRGYSDDFVVKNNKVGINTAEPQVTLDVKGTIKATNLKTSGITTVSSYEGFLNQDQNILESTTIKGGSSLSGEIIVGTGITVTVDSVGITTALVGVGTNYTGSSNNEPEKIIEAGGSQIESLKVYNTFTPPAGGTNERPEAPKPGELYYNYDFKTIEFWDGNNWRQVDNTTRSGKILFGPGNDGINTTSIDTINAHTLGNATYFGEVSPSAGRATYGGGGGNHQRGLFTGGFNYSNVIDYVTIQSEGNAIDFGDLSKPAFGMGNSSSSTRSILWFGFSNTPATGSIDNIEYVEIATTGDSQDFGDSGQTVWSAAAGASPTRGVYSGLFGPSESSAADNQYRYITIASKGNAIQFGELSGIYGQSSGKSNSVRFIRADGVETNQTYTYYITIPTLGKEEPFGELSSPRHGTSVSCTQTRGIIAGGNNPSGSYNIIEYITMSSAGNGVDFGDLTTVKRNSATISDSHGGLGGF